MLRKPIARGSYVALGVSSFLTLGAIYTVVSYVIHIDQPDNKTVPTWSQIYRDGFLEAFFPRTHTLPKFDWDASAGKLVEHEETTTELPWVVKDGQATLTRLVLAMGLALLIGVPLGLLMGCYTFLEAYFLPPLAFLAKIPSTAMIVPILTLASNEQQFHLAIILFGLIPTFAQTIFHVAKEDVPEELLFKARTLGANQIECIWDVIFKFILPKVLETTRLLIGPAIVYLMASEYARGEVGFGCRMRLVIKSFNMSWILVYLITLGIVFLVVDWIFMWAQRKICPWYGGE
jgi:NitT/TauT family transport system permease protein